MGRFAENIWRIEIKAVLLQPKIYKNKRKQPVFRMAD